MRYCGRDFTKEEIDWIKQLIKDRPEINRTKISVLLCQKINWLKADGGLKDMSCRVALLRMEKDGLFTLPAPWRKHVKPYRKIRTLLAMEQPVVTKKAGEFNLVLEVVAKKSGALWNEFIDRYHYLSYKTLPGAQLRYIVKSEGQILALLGFGAAAWTTAPRDKYIGWDNSSRKKNLHLVINNARFLILPWIHSKNLASKILSLVSRKICSDWEERYNYRPVLLETFVEKQRFQGTCYKAANWICVGDTCGRGKLGQKKGDVPVKSVWLYPLCPDFRSQLAGSDQ